MALGAASGPARRPGWLRGAAGGCSVRLPCSVNFSKLLLLLALVSTIVLVSLNFDAQKVEGLLMWVQDNPRQGSFLFMGMYTAGVVLMVPAMVMAMAAGAVFGMVAGTALVWVGSSVGQTIAFVIGRYLLRELVVQYLTKQFPKWTAIDKALETEGWKLVTLLRLSPIAPWNVLNYALSVTAVPLAAYFLASALAILPYLLLFVYFGSLARNLADIFTGKAGLGTNGTIVFAVISGVLMVVIVWYTTHLSRKAISNALLTGGDEVAIETVADTEVAELLRVNSSDALAAAEHIHTPMGTGRGTSVGQHVSIFAASPRSDGGIELAAAYTTGSGGGSLRSSAAGTPLAGTQQGGLVAKKNTPASAAETQMLLDRMAADAGGGSSAGVHLRASYTGGGSGTPNGFSPNAPGAAAVRSRLTSAL